MTTAYDQWLFSDLGNEPEHCPHCDAHLDDCICDEDYDLQQELTKSDSQIDASTAYMKRVNESKN